MAEGAGEAEAPKKEIIEVENNTSIIYH